MADTGLDIMALTDEQQEALQTYTAVTNEPIEKATPMLQRCQWNSQIAITRFFDGEPAEDPLAEAQRAAQAQAAQQPFTRQQNLQESLLNGRNSPRSSIISSRRVRIEPAPRVVPQPESQIQTQVPFVLVLFWAPFSLVYSLASKWLRFMGYLFPFLPRAWGRLTASNIATSSTRRQTSGRRPLNTRDTAARFLREFGEEYGSQAEGLPHFEGGYAQAFDSAKKDLKFFLVVLISPEHDETTTFIRSTLLSPSVVSFIRDPSNNITFWAGNIQDSEAYQVSIALSCTKFPFSCLIVHTPQVSSTAMGIATRIAGPTTPEQYIARLKAAIATHIEPLSRARAQRAEQTASRTIRQEQDSAYERSLATDRARAAKKKEEALLAQRAEKEALKREEAAAKYALDLLRWRKWRASIVQPEPPASAKDTVRISLRLPSSERVIRRFAADADIEELYAFVECYDILASRGDAKLSTNDPSELDEGIAEPPGFKHEYEFRLVSPLPREVFEVDKGGSVRERIGRSGNLIVEMLGAGEESEEEDE